MLEGMTNPDPNGPTIGDRVQFAIDAGGGQVMQGEGYVVALEPRGPEARQLFCFLAVLGVPSLLTLPVFVCRIVERGALLRRVALS